MQQQPKKIENIIQEVPVVNKNQKERLNILKEDELLKKKKKLVEKEKESCILF